MQNDGYRCVYCPYYKQITSYGTEWLKCGNTNCIHYGTDYTEVEDEVSD